MDTARAKDSSLQDIIMQMKTFKTRRKWLKLPTVILISNKV